MKISIITVCFNGAATIGNTIQSVASQTYKNKEHFIIDGASKDRTMSIVREAPSITCYVSEPDNGIYDAMNKGLLIATGDVVGFLNSDDFYENDDVLMQVANIFNDSEVDACYSDLVYVSREDTDRVVRYWKSKAFESGSFQKGWVPPHPTFFLRRSVYEKFGGFDLEYKIAADAEILMRFLAVHKIRTVYIPKVFVKMRMGGTTNSSLKNVINQNLEIMAALKKNGLNASWLSFVFHKIFSRGKQFFLRPERSSVVDS